jgi:hypothetical protein
VAKHGSPQYADGLDAILFDWPFLASACGVVGLIVLLLLPRSASAPSRWRDPVWLVCLVLPVYTLHQFEEHGFNLLGQRFHFLVEMCGIIGHPALAGCPADRAFILAANLGGAWIPGLCAILWRRRNLMVGACAFGVPLVNAGTHIGSGVIRGAYNSGLLTSLVLFVPLCAWALITFRRAGVLPGKRILAVIAAGALVHVVLIGSLLLHGRGLLSETPLLVINVVNGFIPLAVGLLARSHSADDEQRAAA